jgi:hypothetical protein
VKLWALEWSESRDFAFMPWRPSSRKFGRQVSGTKKAGIFEGAQSSKVAVRRAADLPPNQSRDFSSGDTLVVPKVKIGWWHQLVKPLKNWLGREDSNLRMPESKSGALPLGYAPSICRMGSAGLRGSDAAVAGRREIIGNAAARQ